MTLFPVVMREPIAHGMVWQQRYKVSLLETPSQTATGNENVSEQVYDTFEHFYQINKYNEVGQLLLRSLDKVGKERGGVRYLNTQLKYHKNDLKASVTILKDTFVSCSCWAGIMENQTQNLMLQKAELHCQLRNPCILSLASRAGTEFSKHPLNKMKYVFEVIQVSLFSLQSHLAASGFVCFLSPRPGAFRDLPDSYSSCLQLADGPGWEEEHGTHSSPGKASPLWDCISSSFLQSHNYPKPLKLDNFCKLSVFSLKFAEVTLPCATHSVLPRTVESFTNTFS